MTLPATRSQWPQREAHPTRTSDTARASYQTLAERICLHPRWCAPCGDAVWLGFEKVHAVRGRGRKEERSCSLLEQHKVQHPRLPQQRQQREYRSAKSRSADTAEAATTTAAEICSSLHQRAAVQATFRLRFIRCITKPL